MKKLIILLLTFSFCLTKEVDEVDGQGRYSVPRIGNFSLPISQQPGPLISFGQNILDKYDTLASIYVDYLKGKNKKDERILTKVLYGITDHISIFIEFPYTIKQQLDHHCSQGIEDLLVQTEYILYAKYHKNSIDVITLVTGLRFSNGNYLKIPPTGFGSSSFFLGLTASHTATDWYYYASSGAILTTNHFNTKFGNQFLYQLGLSKNIWYKKEKFIFNWMIEFDGTYSQKDKIAGKINLNTGGNEILLGASLFFSTQKIAIHGGISWFIYQHLFGDQKKDKYYASINFSYKF